MPASSLSSGLDQALWLSVLTICAVFMVLALWRKRRAGHVTPGELLREQRARVRDQREICKTTEELLGRLEQTISSATARAEEQSLTLRKFIHDADERLDRLAPLLNTVDGLRARLSRAAQRTATLTGVPQITAPIAAPFADDQPLLQPYATDAPRRLPQPMAPPPRATTPSPPNLRFSAKSADQRSASHARFGPVYDLADAGRTPAEIAAALRLPLGEVELVLNLRSFV